MATSTTQRFALTLGGSLSDHDKTLLDAILAAYEVHDHNGGDRLADPSAAPSGTIDTTGGSLQSGVTYYYRVSYVDPFGLETAATQEVAFSTPSPLASPGQPGVTMVTGGALMLGVTYFALSAVDAVGNETVLSDPTLVTITGSNLTAQIIGEAFFNGSISHYNVWRQSSRSTGFTKIGAITDPTVTFVDDGSVPDDPNACNPTNLPPTSNRTNSTSEITITVPDPDLVGNIARPVLAWRVYRTTSSGNYGKASLLQEVTTTVNSDGTGGLVSQLVDDGTLPIVTGAPLEVSETLAPSVLIKSGSGGGGGLIQNPILTAVNTGEVYRVDAEQGVLVAYPVTERTYGQLGTSYPIGSGPCFLGAGVVYRLLVDRQGGLRFETTVVDATYDNVYELGHGPRIVTLTGSKLDLTINAGGALVLTDVA